MNCDFLVARKTETFNGLDEAWKGVNGVAIKKKD
jgi:hypothetical protein